MSAAARAERWLDKRLPKLRPGGSPDRLPVTLHRQRIYILPTYLGLLFSLLLFVMLLGSLNYNNNLSILLTFLLGSMALLATVHTYRNLAGITAKECHAAPVFAGEQAHFILTLINQDQRARCMIQARCEDQWATVNLHPQASGTLGLSQPTVKRGWHTPRRIQLFTVFPLGLFHAWTWLDEPGRVLVYPKPEEAPYPLFQGTCAAAHTIPSGDDYAGLRPYRPGDPSRLIAWKASAHTEKLLSKEFHASRQGVVWLDYNVLEGLDLEARLSRLTRGVLDAQAQNLRYGLRLPGQEIQPASDVRHHHTCLRALALFGDP